MKDILRRIANLVVEIPPEQQEDESLPTLPEDISASCRPEPLPVRKSVADLVKEAPGPNLEDVRAHPPEGHAVHGAELSANSAAALAGAPSGSGQPAIMSADGQVDVAAIYQLASLPTTAFPAEQAIDMIQGMPAELAVETKRAMVKTMIASMGKSIGVTPESIVVDAARKTKALVSFVEDRAQKAAQLIAIKEQDIATMEAKITESRSLIDNIKHQVAKCEAQCKAEATRLHELSEFFSLDASKTADARPATGPAK